MNKIKVFFKSYLKIKKLKFKRRILEKFIDFLNFQ